VILSWVGGDLLGSTEARLDTLKGGVEGNVVEVLSEFVLGFNGAGIGDGSSSAPPSFDAESGVDSVTCAAGSEDNEPERRAAMREGSSRTCRVSMPLRSSGTIFVAVSLSVRSRPVNRDERRGRPESKRLPFPVNTVRLKRLPSGQNLCFTIVSISECNWDVGSLVARIALIA
jgi:hypothetical protein